MTVNFPSVEWFEAVKELVNSDETYRRIGTCDATVGISISDREKYFVVTFEAFACLGAREVTQAEAQDADFYLSMPYEGWKEMLGNIKEHSGADLGHTLNTLDLNDPEGVARSRDGYRRDLFYRFNESFQYFFDASHRLDTQFVN